MSILDKAMEFAGEFASLDDELMRYTYLIELGTLLPAMEISEKIDENIFEGCQSKVWLKLSVNSGMINISADSNTAIMRGVLYVIREIYSGAMPEEMADCETDILEILNLKNEFTSERSQGITGILKSIKTFAKNEMNNN